MSLGVLKRLSTETLKRKVEVLKKRIWLAAATSATAALVPVPGVSIAADAGLIVSELQFYRYQLGLPEEGSDGFKMLTATTQANVKACLSILELATKGTGWLVAYATDAAAKAEGVRLFLSVVGSVAVTAGGMSFGATYFALKDSLERMEDAAFKVLSEAAEKSANDLPEVD